MYVVIVIFSFFVNYIFLSNLFYYISKIHFFVSNLCYYIFNFILVPFFKIYFLFSIYVIINLISFFVSIFLFCVLPSYLKYHSIYSVELLLLFSFALLYMFFIHKYIVLIRCSHSALCIIYHRSRDSSIL